MVEAKAGKALTVDLQAQQVQLTDGRVIAFRVDAFRRDCLLHGLDDIGLTEKHADAITAFEAKQKTEQPWLWV